VKPIALLAPLLVHFLLAAPLFPQDKTPPKPEPAAEAKGRGSPPDDFAGAMQIAGTAGSLMVLELPQQVYSGLERIDRGDLRVFDSSGASVPFVVRSPPRQVLTPPPQPVPFFIWRPGEQSLPSSRDIEIDTSGGVVRIRDSAAASANLPVYLADFSALPQPPAFVNVTVDHADVFFNGSATVHTSSDLSQWRAFARSQTIAYYGDYAVTRDQLEIPPGARYALISFDQGVPPLVALEAVFAPQEVSTEIRETPVLGEKSGDGIFAYYDVLGYYPITAIDFRFQEPDSVLAYIRNRLDRGDERHQLQMQGRIYRFQSGDSVRTNAPFSDSRIASAGRYWELEAQGEMPFGSIPVCYVIWEPSQLVFLARGGGPWTLAYGNSECPPLTQSGLTLSPDDTLIPATLTGESRYTPRPAKPAEPARNWPQWVLWGTLILAAGVLSLLAFFIARSMKNSDVVAK